MLEQHRTLQNLLLTVFGSGGDALEKNIILMHPKY